MGRCGGNCSGEKCEDCGKYICGHRDCDRGFFSGSWVKVGAESKWLCYICEDKIDKLEEIRKLLLEHMDTDAADAVMHKIDRL